MNDRLERAFRVLIDETGASHEQLLNSARTQPSASRAAAALEVDWPTPVSGPTRVRAAAALARRQRSRPRINLTHWLALERPVIRHFRRLESTLSGHNIAGLGRLNWAGSAHRGRLGKDRSRDESRHSIAKRDLGFTAGNGSSFLLSLVRIVIGGINVGHSRFRYPRGIRERFLHHAVMIGKSSTPTGTYCLLTTIVSNAATSPTTSTRIATPALTVQ